MDLAGGRHGAVAAADRPGPHFVRPHCKEADQVQRAVGGLDQAGPRRLGQPVVGQESGLVIRRQGGDFGLQRRAKGQQIEALFGAGRAQRFAFRAQGVVVARVRHHQQALLRQKAEAADAPGFFGGQFQIPQRPAFVNRRLAFAQHVQFRQTLLQSALDLLFDFLHAPLDFFQIGHGQVQQHRVELARRIQRLPRPVHLAKGLHDQGKRIRLAQKRIQGTESAAFAPPRQGDIHKRHFRGNVFFRLEQVAERRQPGIGHLDGAEPVGALGREMRSLRGLNQRIKHRRLARRTGADQIQHQSRHEHLAVRAGFNS